jgi:hypothetical protein
VLKVGIIPDFHFQFSQHFQRLGNAAAATNRLSLSRMRACSLADDADDNHDNCSVFRGLATAFYGTGMAVPPLCLRFSAPPPPP